VSRFGELLGVSSWGGWKWHRYRKQPPTAAAAAAAAATEPLLKVKTSKAQPVIAELLRLELGSKSYIITEAKLTYLGHHLLGCNAFPKSFVEVDNISNLVSSENLRGCKLCKRTGV